MAEANIHAGCVLVGDRGVLVRGDAGSGKTSLALELVTARLRQGGFARLVADDRVELTQAGGRLIARAPGTVAGLIEVRGLGVQRIAHSAAAVVDLVVTLVLADTVERIPEARTDTLLGVPVRSVRLAERNGGVSAPAVFAALGLPPFR